MKILGKGDILNMLQLINDNGVLFSGVFAVVTALITAIISI